MAADADGVRADFVFHPAPAHRLHRWFQLQHAFVKLARARNVCDRDADECDLGDHAAVLAAATAFCAASVRSSAAMSDRPDSFSSFLPASTFVPSSRTTSGTERFTVLAALMMPWAITSHFMMPPKMFTRIVFTFLSATRMRNASVTCSSLAPPPTSRKFAGEPP